MPKAHLPTPEPAGPFQKGWALFLLGLIIFGIGLRWWQLGSLPGGVYQDEAAHGLDALAGDWRLYYPANNGREPLFIWLVTLSVRVLGPTALALRLPAALLGTLTIPATALLANCLFDRRVGWLAAVITALTFWPLALSRVSFRAAALPLLLALSVAAAWVGVRDRRWRLAALGGALYGLSFYTYSAARFTPLVLLAWGGWALWHIRTRPYARYRHPYAGDRHRLLGYKQTRPQARPHRELLAFGLTTLLVGMPLIWLTLTDTELVMGRLGQVGVFAPAALLRQLWASLLMFNWAGDTIGRHNLVGRPVFDLLLGIAFLVGLLRLLRRATQGDLAAGLVLAWTIIMLGPSVLAADAPHFLRAAGVLPAALLLAAEGLLASYEHLIMWAGARWSAALLAGVLALSGALTTRDYFGRYAAAEETGVWFQQPATTLAHTVLADPAPAWVDARLWDSFPSVRYLLAARPDVIVYHDVPGGWPAPEGGQIVVWPYEDFSAVFAAVPPGMTISRQAGPDYREERSADSYSLYTRLQAVPNVLPEPLARFGITLNLLAAEWRDTEQGLWVRQQWQAEATPEMDYHIFVHVITAEGQTVAVADSMPLDGDWPFSRWAAGTVVRHDILIPIPDNVQSATLQVLTGVYDPASGARLPLHPSFITSAGDRRDAWIVTPAR